MSDGYIAGFNYYMDHGKLAADCEGKPWAKPLTVEDLFAYYYWLAQLASDAGATSCASARSTAHVPGASLATSRAARCGSASCSSA